MTEAAFRTRQRIEANDTGTPLYVDSYYDGWRDDALAAISRAAPLTKSATIAIVDGTETYNVPSDFITAASDAVDIDRYPLYRITTHADAVLTLDVDFAVRGRSIVLASDPDYTGNWTLTYGGTWVITELPADWIEMALDYATARFYDRRGTDAAATFSFEVASTRITRDNQPRKWEDLRDARMARFTKAVSRIATAVSMIGTITVERA